MGEQAICAIKSLCVCQLHIFTSTYKCCSKFPSLQVPANVMQDPWNCKDLWTSAFTPWSCCSLQVTWGSTRSPAWSPAWLWFCGVHPYAGLWGEKVHPMLDRRKGCEQVRYKHPSEREFVKTSHVLWVCIMFAKGVVIALSLCVVSVNLVLISLYP